MKLKYMEGGECDDALFDKPLAEQHLYIAKMINMNPNDPSDWTIEIFDRLLSIRRLHGKEKFYREIGQMLSPNFH